MSDIVKLGPLWNRVTLDGKARVVKQRGRTLARLDDVAAFEVVEYIADKEEIELLNAHPEVQKEHRQAELWLELRGGKRVLAATMDQAGLLLAAVSPFANAARVPVKTDRRLVTNPLVQKAS